MYLDKVKDFLASYDGEKEELDVAAQKEILGLLLRKIIINKRRNERPHPLVSPVFYEPFEKINENIKKSLKERKNCAAISLKPTAAIWGSIYHKLKAVLEFIYRDQL